MLELDHVFCFVEPGFAEEERVRSAGFEVSFGRKHHGQGTENRLLLFDDAYIEFIWIRDRDEARRNILRFDRRARACPFGIALRGSVPRPLRRFFWRYRLPDFPLGSLAIFEPSRREPMLPILFVMQSKLGRVDRPRDRGYPSTFFEHENGCRRIEHCRVTGPGVTRLVLPASGLPVSFREGPSWHLDLQIGGGDFEGLSLPQLTLRSAARARLLEACNAAPTVARAGSAYRS